MRSRYSCIIKKHALKRKKNSSKEIFLEVPVNVDSSVSGHPTREMLPFRDTGNLCLTSAVLGGALCHWEEQERGHETGMCL